jgi:hypothetical protein
MADFTLREFLFFVWPVAIALLTIFIVRKSHGRIMSELLGLKKRQTDFFRLVAYFRNEIKQDKENVNQISEKIEILETEQFLLTKEIDSRLSKISEIPQNISSQEPKGWTDEKRKQMSEIKKAYWAQKKAAQNGSQDSH